MNINYIDMRADVLAYKFTSDAVYVHYTDKVYKADFSSFTDGEMVKCNIQPIAKAYKKDNVLYLTLRKAVDVDGTEILQDDFSIDKCEDIEVKWKTQSEIEDEKLLESLIPTQEEIRGAELEINVINLLQDLEVI